MKINLLENIQKKYDKIFCQLKNLLYFCTRFREGSDAHKKEEKNILKNIWWNEKKVVPLHPQKRRGDFQEA